MRAFESSPVHCLKPLPSGKRHMPANAGARAILQVEFCVSVDELGVVAGLTNDQYHLEFLWRLVWSASW